MDVGAMTRVPLAGEVAPVPHWSRRTVRTSSLPELWGAATVCISSLSIRIQPTTSCVFFECAPEEVPVPREFR
jgi:hypothetical protein